MVETKRRFRGPYFDFGEFLQFNRIWLLMTSNPDIKWFDYFSEFPLDIFIECSIRVNRFVSGNQFQSI